MLPMLTVVTLNLRRSHYSKGDAANHTLCGYVGAYMDQGFIDRNFSSLYVLDRLPMCKRCISTKKSMEAFFNE